MTTVAGAVLSVTQHEQTRQKPHRGRPRRSGLIGSLAAAQAAAGSAVRVTLVDKASEAEAGGNTRWSPSYMRMAAPDRVEPSFVHDMLAATKYQGDEAYFARLAHDAPATVKWIAAQGVEFIQPVYYLAKGPPRIQPLGGGPAVVAKLAAAAKAAGVTFRYGCAAKAIASENGRIIGLDVAEGDVHEMLPADAVILGSGGFEGDGAAMREHFGDGAQTMRLISPGGKFNTGDGIKMAMALGAGLAAIGTACMPSRSMRARRIPRRWCWSILTASSSTKTASAFSTKAAAWCTRPGNGSRATCSSRRRAASLTPSSTAACWRFEGYERAIRSEVPPARADTLTALAKSIGVDADGLSATVAAYNAACTGDPNKFDATRCDGLAASRTLAPPKSNWARAIQQPPFLAYPLVGAVAYTFGGLATDASARVLRDGEPMPGLYAAGEITGHFYATAPNAVSVLRAFVFGRIAGLEAVAFLKGQSA